MRKRRSEASRCVTVEYGIIATGFNRIFGGEYPPSYKSLNLGTLTSHLSTDAITSLLDLPLEITDSIINLLHDDQDTLKSCCLVSTPFAPHTRKHLFEEIVIMDSNILQLWKETSPDSPNSPASVNTCSLTFCCINGITMGGLGGVYWIQPFINVIRLEVCDHPLGPSRMTSLEPFHILSAVKSLCLHTVSISSLEIFKLICSLHHLEDLDIIHLHGQYIKDINGWRDLFQALASPPLTGTLEIEYPLKNIACLLLALPDGLHFQKIVWSMDPFQGLEEVNTLVEACSDTLKSIHTKKIHNSESCPFVPCRCFGL